MASRASVIRSLCTTLGIAVISVAMSGTAHASGGYSGGPPPKPPVPADQKDMLFDLGQQVYNGTLSLPPRDEGKAANQAEKLRKIQDGAGAGRVKDLSANAGRLSDQQLKALEHFVAVRFGGK